MKCGYCCGSIALGLTTDSGGNKAIGYCINKLANSELICAGRLARMPTRRLIFKTSRRLDVLTVGCVVLSDQKGGLIN